MQPDVQDRSSKENRDAGERRATRNLAVLYEGLFTVIVRMQAQRQHAAVAETFRGRVKAALQEVERDAVASGYAAQDVKDTHFAVVAFLDSVVLHSGDPIRPEWERKTLQEELFGQTDAGVVFFEKLENFRSRPDSEQLADVLEVYLLCLLMGFEGRYSERQRGEVDSIVDKVRRRIDDIRAHSTVPVAEPEPPPEQSSAGVPQRRQPVFLLVTLAAVAITILLFVFAKLDLLSASARIRDLF